MLKSSIFCQNFPRTACVKQWVCKTYLVVISPKSFNKQKIFRKFSHSEKSGVKQLPPSHDATNSVNWTDKWHITAAIQKKALDTLEKCYCAHWPQGGNSRTRRRSWERRGNQGGSGVKLNDTIRFAIPENHILEPKITTLSYTQAKLWPFKKLFNFPHRRHCNFLIFANKYVEY